MHPCDVGRPHPSTCAYACTYCYHSLYTYVRTYVRSYMYVCRPLQYTHALLPFIVHILQKYVCTYVCMYVCTVYTSSNNCPICAVCSSLLQTQHHSTKHTQHMHSDMHAYVHVRTINACTVCTYLCTYNPCKFVCMYLTECVHVQ